MAGSTAITRRPRHLASRSAAFRAATAGRQAYRDGKARTECPYNPDGPATQRVLARYWLRGYDGGAKGFLT
ncbi:Rmf/CrpP family protein [Cellulosimicrobium cellulans]|uniref:ribosome modulation factor n=1 Tax=Cellulosimicrobium cellulans TaxID=1710 RepID=UPI0035DBC8A5